jgi:phospholipase A1
MQGIGGSILIDEDSGLHVWIRFYEASYYFQRYMWGKYDESDQTLKPFPGQPTVTPKLTGFGLDAIRNLDPSVDIWPVYDYLTYFDTVIRDLEFRGWVPGYNLFGMPWDWRQSQCWTPTLDRMKDTLLAEKKASGKNVTIISHSMGSLVVKCFLSTYPDIFESTVDAWISIATPFKGAGSKIFMEFLQGYNLGNIVIGSDDAKGLSLESPAVYELLPSLNFEWKQQPPFIALTLNGERHVFDANGSGGGFFDRLLRMALANHTITPPGQSVPLSQPFNEACWNLSLATKARIEAAMLPESVRYYNAFGLSQATPVGLEFAAVAQWTDLETAKYMSILTDGDGTVSAESAAGHGMAARATLTVAADHMGIMTHPDTLQFLRDAVYGHI